MNTIIDHDEHSVNYRFVMNTNARRAEHFGKWLQGELVRQRISQSELARRMGKDRGQIGTWYRGERLPTTDSLDALSEALGLPLRIVYRVAGVPLDEPVDDDSVRGRLIGLVERLDLSDQGKVDLLESMLRSWINDNRHRKEDES